MHLVIESGLLFTFSYHHRINQPYTLIFHGQEGPDNRFPLIWFLQSSKHIRNWLVVPLCLLWIAGWLLVVRISSSGPGVWIAHRVHPWVGQPLFWLFKGSLGLLNCWNCRIDWLITILYSQILMISNQMIGWGEALATLNISPLLLPFYLLLPTTPNYQPEYLETS